MSPMKMQDEIAAALVRCCKSKSMTKSSSARPAVCGGREPTARCTCGDCIPRISSTNKASSRPSATFSRHSISTPSFAAAAGGLANAYFLRRAIRIGMPPAAAFAKPGARAELALKLSPTLATTHALLGNIEIATDWDWAPASGREIGLALTQAPNDAYVLFIAAVQAQNHGPIG